VEYDADGKMKNVIINDTGPGECGKSYSAAKFQGALMGLNHTVTQKPIW
jgi:hypothetical protein